MSENIICLNHVTKQYKHVAAVTNCSLALKRGRIYGLIGKNGAGKTTIMRMIGGLNFPTEGKVEVGCRKMGMLIEAPGVNGSMTGEENLKFYRILAGSTPSFASDGELLSFVGLENVGKKKVRDYSLGMRQRLGIAIALLGSPDFLMLDEPVNGLDPVGVIEIRNLIRRLNKEYGMTVLISSHNLPELYQTVTDFIIIDKGRIKKEITHEQLEAESTKSLEDYFLSVIQES